MTGGDNGAGDTAPGGGETIHGGGDIHGEGERQGSGDEGGGVESREPPKSDRRSPPALDLTSEEASNSNLRTIEATDFAVPVFSRPGVLPALEAALPPPS